MNRGLLAKTIRETWLMTLLYAMAVALFEVLLAYVIPRFSAEMSEQWLKLDFVRTIFKGLLGTEVAEMLGPEALASMAWVHPLLLTLVWAHAVTFCSRFPAGEIDRGTIDIALALPVSRLDFFCGESLVWLGSGLVVVLAGLAGSLVGVCGSFGPQAGAGWDALPVLGNLYCLYLAVGGIAWLASSLCNRRGRAVSIALAFVLVSYTWNFLVQFWDVARALPQVSVLYYYRPLATLHSPSWPWPDMLVLLCIASVTWAAAGLVFRRRDICTV